jgi:dTDP-4-dehydrorhamnose 3,5-epimerase
MGAEINNNQNLIEGVFFSPLKQIKDDRGVVLHHLNYKSPSFKGFEEVYISKTFPGKIKAWKQHLKMTQNFCVPVGGFKFVLYDGREDSSTFKIVNEFIVNEGNSYNLLCIPPKIWYGFQCISPYTGVIVNLSDLYCDPEEVVRLDIKNEIIPFCDWEPL